MNLIEFPDYCGHTLFCDDIRNEVGGKTTYVGVYQANLFIHGPLPFVMPKLALSMTLTQRQSKLVTKGVFFRIYLPGDSEDEPASIEIEIPEDGFGPALDRPDTMTVEGKEAPSFNTSMFNTVFSPIQFRAEGAIRVRAVLGDNYVKLGSLLVQRAPVGPSKKKSAAA
jgi:hypothetical protein